MTRMLHRANPLAATTAEDRVYIVRMTQGKEPLTNRPEPALATPSGPVRRIVVCADDYGLSPGIGVAIRDLLHRGRISATSAMTAGPFWPSEAERLRPFAGRADLGLHLTLTDQAPAGPCTRLAPNGHLPPLPKLVTAALLGQLPLDEIEVEMHRQLDRFESAMGISPDHLDGHQHVHGLPGIRDVVMRVCDRRLPSTSYIRATDAPMGFLVKAPSGIRAAIVALLGHGLTVMLKTAGRAHNKSFSGVRTFTEAVPYLALFEAALAAKGADLLVMCHPGLADNILGRLDPVVHPREAEYRTLRSDEFARMLADRGVAIGRLLG